MTSGSACERPGCGQQIPPSRGQNARWCSRKCEGKAYRTAKLIGIPVADYPPPGELLPVGSTETLADAYARIPKKPTRDHPRQYSDFGDVPGDIELAAAIDDEQNIEAGTLIHAHPDDVRINAMLRSDASAVRARTPQSTWRAWRAYGRRHGIEHPEQTADRIRRHQADEAARAHRIDGKAASGPQDRFDARTQGHVASRAAQSRRLNSRHVDLPPMHERQGFDFEPPEQIMDDFYRGGPRSGQQAKDATYAWHMDDGFRF